MTILNIIQIAFGGLIILAGVLVFAIIDVLFVMFLVEIIKERINKCKQKRRVKQIIDNFDLEDWSKRMQASIDSCIKTCSDIQSKNKK